jgi:hypothetical protein
VGGGCGCVVVVGIERTEAKQGVESGERDDPITDQIIAKQLPFTELLPCAAAPPPKPNPELTLNADCTATARAPGLHRSINLVTHLRAKQRGMARKGGGKQRVSERECKPGMRGTGEAQGNEHALPTSGTAATRRENRGRKSRRRRAEWAWGCTTTRHTRGERGVC